MAHASRARIAITAVFFLNGSVFASWYSRLPDIQEQLDIGPDAAHGPGTSSSYLAGPVSDTVGHSDGERVTVSKGASKAAQVDARANPVSYTHLTLPTNREV